jgi:hypothetical protein
MVSRVIFRGRDQARESSLNAYEIRILKSRSRTPEILACFQASDHAAIRRAISLIEKGDGVEVWRGMDCVFTLDMPSVTQ